MRLCAPLEDIDAKMIAEHLGFIITTILVLIFCELIIIFLF